MPLLLCSVVMNGVGVRRSPSISEYDSRNSLGLNVQPSSKVLLNGYMDSLGGSRTGGADSQGYTHVRIIYTGRSTHTN